MYLDDVDELLKGIWDSTLMRKKHLMALVHPDDLKDLRKQLEDLGGVASAWRADFNVQYNGWVISANNKVRKGKIMYARVYPNQFIPGPSKAESVVKRIANKLRSLADDLEK